MTNIKRSASTVAGAAALAFVGALAIGCLPLMAGLTMAAMLVAGFGSVAFTAQSRRFDDRHRLVYRPVYVRSRTVHRRVSSFDD